MCGDGVREAAEVWRAFLFSRTIKLRKRWRQTKKKEPALAEHGLRSVSKFKYLETQVVAVTLFTLLLAMAVHAAHSLLLRAGDVEQNPGPLSEEGTDCK